MKRRGATAQSSSMKASLPMAAPPRAVHHRAGEGRRLHIGEYVRARSGAPRRPRSRPPPIRSALDGLARPARVVHGRLALRALDPEDVRLEGNAAVELDDLGERVAVPDPECLLQSTEEGVVEAVEPIA